jgi:MFS transporter, DHA1 family, multidrug resistance protein
MAGADASLSLWRRNLVALTGAVFVGFTGFTLVMPFLPIYIGEMGEHDVATIAAWTGVTLGVTPAMTALFAPLWGRLADRFGRRFMVARSLASFVVIMAAMAYVTRPWHLFALRVVQGFFAGYGALCLAMAAESAPAGRMAQSIGVVQTAQRLGPALGPVLGGLSAGLIGLRATFLVTAGFYALALVILLALYREPHHAAPETGRPPSGSITFRSVLAFEHFLLLMGVIFGFQFVDRSLGPVLPLYIAGLGVSTRQAALASGIIFSVIACAAALGHHYCSALLRRWSGRRAIARAAVAAAVAAGLMGVAPGLWWLGAAALLFGASVGVAMTAAYTMAASAMPPHARATGFGFLSSASLVAMAASPMVAGLLAQAGIRTLFLVNGVLLLMLGLAVRHLMAEPAQETTAPVVEDA